MHSHSTPAAIAAALLFATAFASAQVTAPPSAAAMTAPATGTPRAARNAAAANAAANATRPCTAVTVDPPTVLTLGKSRVVHLDYPATRIVVGGSGGSRAGRPVNVTPVPGQPAPQVPPGAAAAAGGGVSDGVADTEITLLGPNELFFLGRRPGSMNVVVQASDGRCFVKDIVVTVDPTTLQSTLATMMPEETGVKVHGSESTLVLTGTVSDPARLEQVLALANTYGDPKRLVNLVRVTAPQQVMLEVKIAEVSKTLLDKLGSRFNYQRTTNNGLNTYSLITDFLSGGGALAQALRIGRGSLAIDGQKDDGLVRVLAEPNIMAISGQSASFLSGGKIFIPVAQSNSGTIGGGTTITLEEKEFGVGLKFSPTVFDGRVNLKVVSEVSELSQTGTPFTTVNGVTAILPSLTVRRVDTTVQLHDGQSFVVAGLIRNNVTEALKRVPGLGEVPIMGALFRSTEFQSDQTELMFVVTPRLVKPLAGAVVLPTDNHTIPSRADMMFMGRTEGRALPPAPGMAMPAAPAQVTSAPAMSAPMTSAPAISAPAEPAPATPATPATVAPAPGTSSAAPAPMDSAQAAAPAAMAAPAPAEPVEAKAQAPAPAPEAPRAPTEPVAAQAAAPMPETPTVRAEPVEAPPAPAPTQAAGGPPEPVADATPPATPAQVEPSAIEPAPVIETTPLPAAPAR